MSWIRGKWAGVPADVRVFLAFLVAIVPAKAAQTYGLRWMNIDGGFYTEVARHVRDGLGLSTHVSLDNFGYESFPHQTSLYPLWPLVLGVVAKVWDLQTAAHWLPAGLYVGATVAAFLFGRRVWPDAVFPASGVALNGGHVAAALLAFNRQFIGYTSTPYTEALAWLLFFMCFWRLAVRAEDTSPRWSIELGVWLSLLFFARSQFMVAGLAVGGALFVRFLVGPERGRWLRHGLVVLAVLVLSIGAWFLHLKTFLVDAGPLSLLRFDQNRASSLLSDFDVIVQDDTALDALQDRIEGVAAGYSIASATSWHPSFGTANWALPAAAVFAAFGIRRPEPGVWRRCLEGLRSPGATLWVSMVLFAVGGMVSIQVAHKHFNGEWYFYRRQGMIAMFAFLLPMMWLLRRRGMAGLVGGALLASSVSLGVYQFAKCIRATETEIDAPDKYAPLVGWLKQHSSKKAPITVGFEEGTLQRVAWRTRDVGYHWIASKSTYADVRAMVDKLHTDYLILSSSRRRSWTLWEESGGRFEAEFERLPDSPSGFDIYVPRHEPAPPPLSRKVLLIGVDGASWKVMGPMIARGELPSFRRLWEEGASQVDFDTIESTDSPVVWTTVATGRRPKDHGVTDYTEQIAGVGKVPVTSNARKVPAIWNLASDAGKTVGVVNWWASWPAEAVNGYVISDHANPAAAGWMAGKYWKADTDALAALKSDTWPVELAESLRPSWIDPALFPKDDFLRRAGLSQDQWTELDKTPYNERTAYSWLKTFYTLDEPHVRIAIDKMHTDPTDLTMVYLRGPDPVQHYAWNLVEPFNYHTPPESLDRDRGLVEAVYRFTDTFVGELIAAADPNTTIIVHSDHGAEPCADAVAAHSKNRPGCHTKTAKGVFFMIGPGVNPGAHLHGTSPADVMPTMAWLTGLPLSKELAGRPLTEAFQWDYAARFGRTDVDSYGPRKTVAAPTTASPADAQMLEQLQGLGYIE